MRHVVAVDFDGAGVGGDQTAYHVKAGRLAGAVGAEQAHDLPSPRFSDRLTERTTGRFLKLLPIRVTTKP